MGARPLTAAIGPGTSGDDGKPRANAEAVNHRARIIIHRVIARLLLRDPSAIPRAQAALEAQAARPNAHSYIEEWRLLLTPPVAEVARLAVARTERMEGLRNCSLLAALVDISDVEVRLRIWQQAREGLEARWRRDTGGSHTP